MPTSASIIITILDGLEGLGKSRLGYREQGVNTCRKALRHTRTSEFVFVWSEESFEALDERD